MPLIHLMGPSLAENPRCPDARSPRVDLSDARLEARHRWSELAIARNHTASAWNLSIERSPRAAATNADAACVTACDRRTDRP